MSRAADFEKIRQSFESDVVFSSQHNLLVRGDSLETLRRMPSASVSLILTDPPYHSTKKSNIYGDTHFKEDDAFIAWMSEYIKEWHRILKSNGSIFCYCSSEMAARLEVAFSSTFNVLSSIVWTKPNDPGYDGWKGKMKKEALRQFYPHSERIIFCEPATPGNLHRSSFAEFLRAARKRSGLSGHELTEITGAYGKVNHGGAVSNWETGRNIPSREQYDLICNALLSTGNIASMPDYEDVIRPFVMDGTREFTDVWNFPSVRPYKGKHPAEKPLDMLEHAILATSYPGDIVLDAFAGSGSTALAAHRLGRRSISMEIDERWIEQISARLELCEARDERHQVQAREIRQDEPSPGPLFGTM